MVDEQLVVVLGVVLMPRPVAGHVERGEDVHMTILQLRQHVGTYLKEMGIAHAGIQLFLVLRMDLIPVHPFLIEETIVLVHDLPQSLEVSVRTIGELLFVDAGREEQGAQGDEKEEISITYHD